MYKFVSKKPLLVVSNSVHWVRLVYLAYEPIRISILCWESKIQTFKITCTGSGSPLPWSPLWTQFHHDSGKQPGNHGYTNIWQETDIPHDTSMRNTYRYKTTAQTLFFGYRGFFLLFFLRSWRSSWHYRKDKYSQQKSDGVVRNSPYFWGRMMKYCKAEWPERLPVPGNKNKPERTSTAGSVWTSSTDHTHAVVQFDTESQNNLALAANDHQVQEKSVLWVLPHTFQIVICSTIQPDSIHFSISAVSL